MDALRKPFETRLLTFPLDRRGGGPLYRQVYQAIRVAILDGRISSGARLPSTRGLAESLGVSRNTVLQAFEQLQVEGYLISRVGGGSFVTRQLRRPPETTPRPAIPSDSDRDSSALPPETRPAIGLEAWNLEHPDRVLPFEVGVPGLDQFPYRTWSRLYRRRLLEDGPRLLAYSDPRGFAPLREALAQYLQSARGVACRPEQVLVVSGSQQGLDLIARVLLAEGRRVWMEEPGYLGVRGPFRRAGVELVPIPVDEHGLRAPKEVAKYKAPSLIYLTPSNQFPIGVTLSLERRLEWLALAQEHGAWIVEDDYDSEFRTSGSPIQAMQGMDNSGRVIYLGTFSKVLAPGLRLGYLVLPERLLEAFHRLKSSNDLHGPILEQAVLHDFLVEGHFATHLGRMRRLYRRRRQYLVEELEARLGDRGRVLPGNGIMHVVIEADPALECEAITRRAQELGLAVAPLSKFYLGPPTRQGWLLGCAAMPESQIPEAVERLIKAFQGAERRRPV